MPNLDRRISEMHFILTSVFAFSYSVFMFQIDTLGRVCVTEIESRIVRLCR